MPEAKNWPTIPDFAAALQNPGLCFFNGDLSLCQVVQNRRGFPLVYAGQFASVFKVLLGGKGYAIRCFITPVSDNQNHRYGELSAFFNAHHSPFFVECEYQEEGIYVKGIGYPLVRMEWAEGEKLNRFVNDNLNAPERIGDLLVKWRGLLESLRNLGIAHNELQHGNVLVTGDGLRLVDYDAVYLPSYDGQSSPELGHANYQHPLRKLDDFGENSDNFPALVIYLSLLAVSVDPGLFGRFNNESNLILVRKDYPDPVNSECFQALQHSPDAVVRTLAGYLEQYCSAPVDSVPDLETIIAAAEAGQVDAPLRVGHTDASVRLEQATSVSSEPAVPSPSAAITAPPPAPAAQPPDAAPVPPNAGPAQAAMGGHPAFGGRVSGTFRPRLATAAPPSAPPAAPAKDPEDELEAVAADVPKDDTTASVAVPALDEASAASIAAPAPEEAAAASTVSVIISDGSKTDSADVAAILNMAASALAAAAAAMGESGSVQGAAVPAPVVVVLVDRDSTTP